MPKIEEAVGRVLASHRKQAGLTQEELAFRCELHPTYISLLERGIKSPTLRVVFRLAAALDKAPSVLVGDIEQQLKRLPVKKAAAVKNRVPPRGGTR